MHLCSPINVSWGNRHTDNSAAVCHDYFGKIKFYSVVVESCTGNLIYFHKSYFVDIWLVIDCNQNCNHKLKYASDFSRMIIRANNQGTSAFVRSYMSTIVMKSSIFYNSYEHTFYEDIFVTEIVMYWIRFSKLRSAEIFLYMYDCTCALFLRILAVATIKSCYFEVQLLFEDGYY